MGFYEVLWFGAGMFVGVCVGIFIFGLVSASRDWKAACEDEKCCPYKVEVEGAR